MTDRPIIFSAPMIRALLDGRKTQTRRVLKPAKYGFQNNIRLPDGSNAGEVELTFRTGDRLWVREAHYLTDDGYAEAVVYAEDADATEAHRNEVLDMQRRYNLKAEWAKPHLRKRPSIHMPRWASRLTLTVTDVRVQRLQEIRERDALAEGMTFPEGMEWGCDPVEAFQGLWNSIHGLDAWDQNPWVVALTFDVHRCNIDDMRAG